MGSPLRNDKTTMPPKKTPSTDKLEQMNAELQREREQRAQDIGSARSNCFRGSVRGAAAN